MLVDWRGRPTMCRCAQRLQPFGNLQDAVVIKDRDTGRSRGFGFVTYSDDASGQAALQAMNGATLDGRRSIRCDAAVERERGSGPGPRPGGMDTASAG